MSLACCFILLYVCTQLRYVSSVITILWWWRWWWLLFHDLLWPRGLRQSDCTVITTHRLPPAKRDFMSVVICRQMITIITMRLCLRTVF